MHMSRGRTEFSQSGISNVEMKAFADLRGIRFQPFELTAIRALDLAFLKSQGKAADEKKPQRKGTAHGR